MRRHTIVLSDVHLATFVGNAGAMTYRRAEHAPDGHLAAVIARSVDRARRAGAPLELVLNGDLFDLDAPPADGAADAASYEGSRCERTAARIMQRILAEHPLIVQALGRAAAEPHVRLVVIPGNHDAQLAFGDVREVLAHALGLPSPARLVFRSWMHITPDKVLVEHGHQYDPLCALERLYPLRRADGTPRLEDTIGTVGTHYGQAVFPHVNPYAADPFDGDVVGALRQCVRGGIGACAPTLGLLAGVRELLLVQPSDAAPDPAFLHHVARELGVSADVLDQHRALWAPKADMAAVAAAAFKSYDYGGDVSERLRGAMRCAAALHGIRGVVTGHTHEPFLDQDGAGPIMGNAGSWAPVVGLPGADPCVGTYVHVVTDGPRLEARLERVWHDGSVT